MSGVKNLALAETKGLKPITNAALKECGVASKKESTEKYGKEKK